MDHERRVYRWSQCKPEMQVCLEWCNQNGLLTSRIPNFAAPGWTTALHMPHVTFRIFSDTGVTPELREGAWLEDMQAEYSALETVNRA